MWNSSKSLKLSCICTKLVMVFVVLCALALPHLMDFYKSWGYYNITELYSKPFMAILYLCCIPALWALFCLHALLNNIKVGQVFIGKNVVYLRMISWCCFCAAIFLALAGYYYLIFYFVAIMAAFIGLILRVVKNVIEQAVIIKAENDFTI